MKGYSFTASDVPTEEEHAVVRKIYGRLVWFLTILFMISYLDRINISFAALSMNKDLGLNATMYGFASSIFYVLYICAEIPSNMLMPRLGARVWIPRIMITWGLASAGTIFVTGANGLYVMRALTGLAEAGFMPGLLLYLTYWFPASHRARATSFFIMAQPITIMFGSTISGFILEMDGILGLAGWKWLFLMEGLPAVFLGIAAYLFLDNSPAAAKWLSKREKQVLAYALARDEQCAFTNGNSREGSTIREIFTVPVMLLCFVYFGLVISLITNSAWVPQIVKAVHPTSNFVIIGLIGAIPALGAVLTMPLWSKHSDRTGERRWHVALPMVIVAAGWLAVAWFNLPVLRLAGLVLCVVGIFSAQGIFWTLPSSFLSPKARPVGIATINTVGLLGTTIGPVIVGWLKDQTGSFSAGLVFAASCVAAGAIAMMIIPSQSKQKPPQARPRQWHLASETHGKNPSPAPLP